MSTPPDSSPFPQVQTRSGVLEGTLDPAKNIQVFLGIPFAAPPVGALRWREPQPPEPWAGVRPARAFGPRPMQRPVFGDMNFRSPGMSEDCLFLNVWAPARPEPAGRPVLVYFYGGGNIAGDSSEPRYDGAGLAERGILVVTANSRLNVFGFLAHPELSRESAHGGSGNYGYLDQVEALRWVRANITAFGGDPARVTIAGESAGSISVSAHLVSPLSKNLMAGAIGSSGSILGALPPMPLGRMEEAGAAFAAQLEAPSLPSLRALSPEALLEATASPGAPAWTATLDGSFLPDDPAALYAAGQQACVPLLVGWNSEEMNHAWLLRGEDPTPGAFARTLRLKFGDHADRLLQAYPASTNEEAAQAATDLASDLFIGHSTWRWAELHCATSDQPVFRYLYAHPRPPIRPELQNKVPGLAGGLLNAPDVDPSPGPEARGAVHSADIEYFMGNLASNEVYAWTEQDGQLSGRMQSCYVHFVTAGDPNGPGVPEWPPFAAEGERAVMVLDVQPQVQGESHRERHVLLDTLWGQLLGRG